MKITRRQLRKIIIESLITEVTFMQLRGVRTSGKLSDSDISAHQGAGHITAVEAAQLRAIKSGASADSADSDDSDDEDDENIIFDFNKERRREAEWANRPSAPSNVFGWTLQDAKKWAKGTSVRPGRVTHWVKGAPGSEKIYVIHKDGVGMGGISDMSRIPEDAVVLFNRSALKRGALALTRSSRKIKDTLY
jgi:hypothetical protein